MTDIDREKLRELCQRATQGPWVPLKGWPDRIVPATHVARSPGASVSEDEDRDNYALVICRAEHNDYSGFAHEIQESEAIANASFIAAARTALPALLDLTDAQAAKIAELEAALRSARKERDAAICTAGTLKGIGAAFRELESERDQLRKQVEAMAIIDLLRADEGNCITLLCDNPDFNGQPNCAIEVCAEWTTWAPRRFSADTVLDCLRFAAASALEQKEQG